MVTGFGIVFILAIALSIFTSLFVNRLILTPIREATAVINVLAAGDLTRYVPVRTADEIGEMSTAFNAMIANLRNMIGEITASSAAQASASSQISSSTEQMAAGAQEQTAQAGEVASAVEQMSKTIIEN